MRGGQQRRSQPRERDHDVDGAGAEQPQQAPSARARAVRGRRAARAPAAPPATRAASRRRRPPARPRRPAATRAAASRTRARSGSSASTISAIITPSIVSLREVITSIGSTACATAAASPARRAPHAPHGQEQQRHRSVPASASGSFSEVVEKPTSFTLATCSHRSTGGLSIETLPPGSNAPKKKLCQDSSMLRTAAS